MTKLEIAICNVKKKFKHGLWDRNMKQVELVRILQTSFVWVKGILKGNTLARDLEIRKQAAKILGIGL